MALVQTGATRTSARLRRAASVAVAVALLWVPVYLALYTFPYAYTSVSLPGSALLDRVARRLWSVPTYGLANALGMRNDISREVAFYERRNIGVLVNDTPVAVLRGVVLALVSLVAAGAWVVADPSGSRTRSLHRALRLYLRYTLAFILLGYGFAKVFDQQFAFFPLAAVVSPLGDLEPQSLLWTMMGFSRPYAAFAGLMEVAAATLLLFPRTTTLGALLASGVLANVTLLNFTFGVWVKLYALHLLAIALTLAAPDLKRLADVLLWNRSTEARPEPAVQQFRWAPHILKAAVCGYVIWITASGSLAYQRSSGRNAPKPPIYGVYDVKSVERDSDATPASLRFGNWKRLVFERNLDSRTELVIMRADDQRETAQTTFDLRERVVRVQSDSGHALRFTWSDDGRGTLQLRAVEGGERITLRAVPLSSYKLLGTRIRVIERP